MRATTRAPRLGERVRHRDLTQQIRMAELSDGAHTLDIFLSTETSRSISSSITMLAIELIMRLSLSVAASAHRVRLA